MLVKKQLGAESYMHKLDLPPVWLGLCITLSYLFAKYFPIFSFKNNVSDFIAYFLIIIAIIIALWSVYFFAKNKTPIEPKKTPKTLIIQGPFKINRNPIYTSLLIIYFGIALKFGALSAFAPVILFPIIVTKRFIIEEEKTLLAIFGEEGANYIKKTRRW